MLSCMQLKGSLALKRSQHVVFGFLNYLTRCRDSFVFRGTGNHSQRSMGFLRSLEMDSEILDSHKGAWLAQGLITRLTCSVNGA